MSPPLQILPLTADSRARHADYGCARSPGRYVADAAEQTIPQRLPRAVAPHADDVLPPTLTRLLEAADANVRDAAWRAFVHTHSRLLLHTTRSIAREHDGAMDAYLHILDRLRENDHHRLRAYAVVRRSTFSTWLVVVARRLTYDFFRQRYGRVRGAKDEEGTEEQRDARRRLVDLAATAIDLTIVPDHSAAPDYALRSKQLLDVLAAACQSLKPDERLLLRLRFEDNLSLRATAVELQLPTLFHAKRKEEKVLAHLRKWLTDRGVDNADV